MKGLQAAGERIDSALPSGLTGQDRAEVTLAKLGSLMSGYLTVTQSDPEYPRFVPAIGLFENYWAPNPDTAYLATAIDGGGTYRIRGKRGGAPIVNFGVIHGPYMGLTGKPSPHADYDIDTLHIGADGAFEVVLSAVRPEGYAGDWWPLDRRAQRLTVRVVSDDWGKQADPVLTIDRLDRDARKPRTSAAEVRRRIAFIPDYVENTNTKFSRRLSGYLEEGFENKAKELHVAEMGGLAGQVYFNAPLVLRENEVVIMETVVPKNCRYWGVLLTDWVDSTIDWVNNQTSLNRSQARLDSDGKLRIVFSNTDPGVPNWIDMVGRTRAGMQLRWTGCDSAPVPALRKAPLSAVRRSLPPDTPIVSASERDAALRARRESAQLRRLW